MNTKSILSSYAIAICGALLFSLTIHAADKKAVLSSSDEKFVKEAGASGLAAVKLAQLGVIKASSADVKSFAQMIVDDHTKANEELQKLATGKGVELSTVISPDDASTYQNLEKSTGADFDKQFTAKMLNDHIKCVSDFEANAKDSTDNEVRAFSEKMLPTLTAHREKAKELNAK